MKVLVPLVVMACIPFLAAHNVKVPETVSHLSSTMESTSTALIQALKQNQDETFPTNSDDNS